MYIKRRFRGLSLPSKKYLPSGVSILAQTNGPWSASVEVCSEPNRP